MKPHKHAELIKAWADGAEIEILINGEWINLDLCNGKAHAWYEDHEYRIKPQPKEPKYLYVFYDIVNKEFFISDGNSSPVKTETYIGKIKLETNDE